MEKLSNSYQIFLWNLRKMLKIPQKTVAPVIWRPSPMTSSHEPSAKFRENLSSEENKKIEEILKELHVFSRLSVRFPQKFADSDWQDLLEMKSRKARLDQAMFLYRKERLKVQDRLKKKENKRKIRSEAVERSKESSYLFSFQNSEEWQKLRNVVEAYRLENRPILAVDCQFLSDLSPRGRALTGSQLQYLITENQRNPDPFRLYFVNYNRENAKVKELEKDKLQCMKKANVFCPMASGNGLGDTFLGKEIIYLSPDASEELESVEDDKVYVIGGIVDRTVEHGISKNASLEASIAANVQARKLPIDRYIDFKSGSRFLTLLAVAEILRQVNLHGDWKRAMEAAIPVRNTRGVEEKSAEGRAAMARIHEFNREILRRVDKALL